MVVTESHLALLTIFLTHYLIDAGKVVEWFLAVRNGVFNIKNFGFSKERPFAVSVWLLIITDNSIHLIINYLAIKYM